LFGTDGWRQSKELIILGRRTRMGREQEQQRNDGEEKARVAQTILLTSILRDPKRELEARIPVYSAHVLL
jgi:hypothetical protein